MINHDVDIQYVRDNPDKFWNLYLLSSNKQLTVKDIETLHLPNSGAEKWNWNIISKHINIQEVRDNPNKPWDLVWLSCNKQLTVKDIEFLELPNSKYSWDWKLISKYIDIQEIINNPTKAWSRYGLKHNERCDEKTLEFFDAGLLKHLQRNIGAFQYSTDIAIKCE